MSRFLLVESQYGHTAERFLGDGVALARSGAEVCLFLVSDAVPVAVRGASQVLADFTAAGGQVWVDDFTLAQRAVPRHVLADGVAVVGMDKVAESVTDEQTRVVWH